MDLTDKRWADEEASSCSNETPFRILAVAAVTQTPMNDPASQMIERGPQ